LEERAQNEANQFWDWLSEEYPEIKGKKSVSEINLLIEIFCNSCDIEIFEFKRYFWHNSKYQKKRMRI
jgi:hypothetical protein